MHGFYRNYSGAGCLIKTKNYWLAKINNLQQILDQLGGGWDKTSKTELRFI